MRPRVLETPVLSDDQPLEGRPREADPPRSGEAKRDEKRPGMQGSGFPCAGAAETAVRLGSWSGETPSKNRADNPERDSGECALTFVCPGNIFPLGHFPGAQSV